MCAPNDIDASSIELPAHAGESAHRTEGLAHVFETDRDRHVPICLACRSSSRERAADCSAVPLPLAAVGLDRESPGHGYSRPTPRTRSLEKRRLPAGERTVAFAANHRSRRAPRALAYHGGPA